MSRTQLTLLLASLFFIALTPACRKSPESHLVEATKELRDGSTQECHKDLALECGMLVFDDLPHYMDVYACLEDAVNAYVSGVDDLYGSLSDDDFDDIIDTNGIIDAQPLIDFENALSFASYRRWYANVENTWLAAGGTPATVPVVDVFHNEINATLRNEHGAVMIGGQILLRDRNGDNWIFCDCATYEEFLLDPASIDPESDPCAEKIEKQLYSGNGTTCQDEWSWCDGHQYANTKRVEFYLAYVHVGFPFGIEYHAVVRHYKYKNNRWKPSWAHLSSKVYGWHSNTSCDHVVAFAKSHPTGIFSGFKRRRSDAWDISGGTHYTFRNKEVHGDWHYPGNNRTKDLDYVADPFCP